MIGEPDAMQEIGGHAGGPDSSRLSPGTFRAVVSYVLAIGVSVSAAVIALGFVLAIAFGWRTSLAGGAPGPSDLADFSAMPSGLVALRPSAITQLGLALLLATPVARVAASVVGFALEDDRLYVAITLLVLAILLGSIFLIR
ncbi:MAG TPA: DUF1634 domain-containing protein [Candidatus Acidoferrales bacterium]|nr:DUF1634 domain-containing protein [Candidatus Acidoferrales bacterium]